MPEALISLILFASISTLSPGGATTLATASGMQFGYVKSLPLILGIAVGLSTLVASSATGLAALLLAVPEISLAMKAIGSIYLLWLAFKIGRAGAPQAGAGSASAPIGFFG
ncbi:MAG: LysE family transporter, partial [Cohaesibacteraceae bacterium]|nr:LysE family transporter [Cohaesibacteraceae bacterium]